MLTVTDKAAAVLKAAKTTQGAPPEAGVRIVQGMISDDSGKPALAVGFAISDDPAPEDEELEQNGLRIFVQDTLVEPLDGRTLDVRESEEGPELIFR
jgi:Fe-S cluster assembly iron-binding protein IscA